MKTAILILVVSFAVHVASAQTVLEPSNIDDQRSLELSGVLFSLDGKYALAHSDNYVFAWDTRTGSLVRTFEVPNEPDYSSIVESLSISGDGKYVCTTHAPFTALIWGWEGGALLTKIVEPGNFETFTHSQFLRDGKSILLSSLVRSLKAYDIHSGEMIRDFGNASGGMEDFLLLEKESVLLMNIPNGTMLVSYQDFNILFGAEGNGELIFFKSEIVVRDVKSTENGIFAFRFDTYSLDTFEFLYDSNLFYGEPESVLLTEASPDGKFVVRGKTADSPEPTRLADLKTGDTVRILNGEAEGYEKAIDVEFAPNGRGVAVSCGDRIILYDIGELTASVKDQGLHETE